MSIMTRAGSSDNITLCMFSGAVHLKEWSKGLTTKVLKVPEACVVHSEVHLMKQVANVIVDGKQVHIKKDMNVHYLLRIEQDKGTHYLVLQRHKIQSSSITLGLDGFMLASSASAIKLQSVGESRMNSSGLYNKAGVTDQITVDINSLRKQCDTTVDAIELKLKEGAKEESQVSDREKYEELDATGLPHDQSKNGEITPPAPGPAEGSKSKAGIKLSTSQVAAAGPRNRASAVAWVGNIIQNRTCWFTAPTFWFMPARDGTQSLTAQIDATDELTETNMGGARPCYPLLAVQLWGIISGVTHQAVLVQIEPHGLMRLMDDKYEASAHTTWKMGINVTLLGKYWDPHVPHERLASTNAAALQDHKKQDKVDQCKKLLDTATYPGYKWKSKAGTGSCSPVCFPRVEGQKRAISNSNCVKGSVEKCKQESSYSCVKACLSEGKSCGCVLIKRLQCGRPNTQGEQVCMQYKELLSHKNDTDARMRKCDKRCARELVAF